MSSFLAGVLAGFGIAIPVGAIAILIVDTGLRGGLAPGFMAGAGAATADLIYATLAALAGSAVAAMLAPYALGLRLASAAVLMGLGGFGLWRARQIKDHEGSEEIDRAPVNGSGLRRTYFRFLGITLLNPLTIAYFGALILGREAGSTITWVEQASFILGAGLASLSWQTLLAGTGALAGHYLSPKFQLYATIVGNLVVFILGVRILWQLV